LARKTTVRRTTRLGRRWYLGGEQIDKINARSTPLSTPLRGRSARVLAGAGQVHRLLEMSLQLQKLRQTSPFIGMQLFHPATVGGHHLLFSAGEFESKRFEAG